MSLAHNNKRKGNFNSKSMNDNVIGSSSTASNSVDSGLDVWDECNSLLESMMNLYDVSSDNDNNDPSYQVIYNNINEIVSYPNKIQLECKNYIKNEVEPMKEKIQNKMVEEQNRKRTNEEEMILLRKQIEQLIHEKQCIVNELNTFKQQEDTIQNDISELIAETSNEIHEIENFHDICQMKVPRLRQQLSLYGNVTGIKWNFDNEHILSGQIVSYIFSIIMWVSNYEIHSLVICERKPR